MPPRSFRKLSGELSGGSHPKASHAPSSRTLMPTSRAVNMVEGPIVIDERPGERGLPMEDPVCSGLMGDTAFLGLR